MTTFPFPFGIISISLSFPCLIFIVPELSSVVLPDFNNRSLLFVLIEAIADSLFGVPKVKFLIFKSTGSLSLIKPSVFPFSSFILAKIKLSLSSSKITPILFPFLIKTKPKSFRLSSFPLPSTINGSFIVLIELLIFICVPETIKFPFILIEPSLFGCNIISPLLLVDWILLFDILILPTVIFEKSVLFDIFVFWLFC